MKRTAGGALAAMAITVFGASPAIAATTVGQTPSAANVLGCGGASLFVQHQVAGPPTYTVPDDGGVLTSWSVQAGNFASGSVRLKLVRPTGAGTSYAIVAQDDLQPIAQGALNTFTTRIPVTGGEVLSLWIPSGAACFFFGGPGDAMRYLSGSHAEPGVGDVFPTDVQQSEGRVDVSAVIEPDCDGDGFGDETQDDNLLGCDTSSPSAVITKGPNNKTKKKTATFEFSGTDARAVASFQCSLDGGAFAACTSPHTVKVKKGKHTFEVRAVDAAGNVGASASDTWKRKKKKK